MHSAIFKAAAIYKYQHRNKMYNGIGVDFNLINREKVNKITMHFIVLFELLNHVKNVRLLLRLNNAVIGDKDKKKI